MNRIEKYYDRTNKTIEQMFRIKIPDQFNKNQVGFGDIRFFNFLMNVRFDMNDNYYINFIYYTADNILIHIDKKGPYGSLKWMPFF